jgi:hypothetical protein
MSADVRSRGYVTPQERDAANTATTTPHKHAIIPK